MIPSPPAKPSATPGGTAPGGGPRTAPGREDSAAEEAGHPLRVGHVTLNARYVHLAPAPRCLRNAARAAGFPESWVAEYTVRTPPWKIAAEVLAREPDVLGFSVYIWNRAETLAVVELIRKQAPGVMLVLGGPEVSFEPPPTPGAPASLPYVDAVIAGEGEEKWVELLRLRAGGRSPDAATLETWRTYGNSLPALETLPYLPEDLADVAHRMVYLETSRGCPYTCAFCLSALDTKVRLYPLEAVRSAIRELLAAGARRIKFLDRTFNLRRERVHELLGWLMDGEGVADVPDATFHFEMVGDLLDGDTLALLERAPPGRFQFEIGVQTTRDDTQRRIARRQRNDRLAAAVTRLREAGRVHLHLDLIFGLPGETLADIRASFEEALALRPHELQLGFLKFLPGAPIRGQIAACGYVFQDAPPYEVIAHDALPAAEVRFLKRFEEVFDAFYNSGRFRFTLEALFRAMPPWEVFRGLADFYAEHGLLVPAHALEARTEHLLACAAPWLPEARLRDLLKLDTFYHGRARRVPACLRGEPVREGEAVRAFRKAEPDTALAPFAHRIALHGHHAELEPASAPLWYAFRYPDSRQGYFFRPEVCCLDGQEHAGDTHP